MLTTLHTNDAVSAITRLVDMGVEPFLVASSLTLVVAQRLVRKPCAACIAEYQPSPRTLTLLGISEQELHDATPKRGKGCAECGGTGYRGRTGVFEVLPITAALRQVLLTTPTEAAIGAAARAHGMLTLRASALAAAHRGETTYEEVLRATPIDSVTVPRCPTCARTLADDMVCCPWDGASTTTTASARSSPRLSPAPPRSPPRRPRQPRSRCSGPRTSTVSSSTTACPTCPASSSSGCSGPTPRPSTCPWCCSRARRPLEVRNEALRAGADDFLAKPVEPLLLEERVLSLLSRETHNMPASMPTMTAVPAGAGARQSPP